MNNNMNICHNILMKDVHSLPSCQQISVKHKKSNEDQRFTGITVQQQGDTEENDQTEHIAEVTVQQQGDTEENEQTETDSIPLEPGMTVAYYVPNYADEEPQIGTVVSIPDEMDEVVVEWMSGTYSEPWTVCIKQKGSYTTWKESIPSSMILFPIELSQSRRISTTLKMELQYTYAQIRHT